ncbi:hypothetical protein B0H13DRAFT_1934834 [Mycena leptocephala]|nr:hypothetical protein B0H13DRAFT_1934834 [Mycena leptocephala]
MCYKPGQVLRAYDGLCAGIIRYETSKIFPTDLSLFADGDLTELRCVSGSNVLTFPSANFCCTLDRREGINLSGESLPDIRFRILISDSTRRWTQAMSEHRARCTTARTSSFSTTCFLLVCLPSRSHFYYQIPDDGWPPAVDTNVCKALFRSAIQGLALHFLARCDYIYTLDSGRIAEAGTYLGLIARGGEFAQLDREFGWAKAEDAGGEGGTRENGDGDEAQVQVVSVEDAFLEKISTPWTMLSPDLAEDPAIVVKRMELAQRMKMLEGVRKDLMGFEK